jgi:hypothetical protein
MDRSAAALGETRIVTPAIKKDVVGGQLILLAEFPPDAINVHSESLVIRNEQSRNRSPRPRFRPALIPARQSMRIFRREHHVAYVLH